MLFFETKCRSSEIAGHENQDKIKALVENA